MTTETEQTCEHITHWNGGDPTFCCKVAVRRYPAMSGGYMHLCIEHAKGHESYAELCYPATPEPR